LRPFQGILNEQGRKRIFRFPRNFFVAIYPDETRPENHLEQSTRLLPPSDAEIQRRRMLIALAILLLALGAVIIKDWDFWFPTRVDSPEISARKAKNLTAETQPAPAAPVHERKPGKTAEPEQPADNAPISATTERTVLPPLQVEVVAGNQHLSVPGRNPAIRVDVGTGVTGPSDQPAASQSGMVSAADRVDIPPQIQQRLSVAVPPDYPLLARQMKVQGAVSLQALIARDGTIQELQILSGPEILATAAREAVKQWHFKPYLQGGQPVETQARITVNFTISTN
jgi:periplasmic protein TonB